MVNLTLPAQTNQRHNAGVPSLNKNKTDTEGLGPPSGERSIESKVCRVLGQASD